MTVAYIDSYRNIRFLSISSYFFTNYMNIFQKLVKSLEYNIVFFPPF